MSIATAERAPSAEPETTDYVISVRNLRRYFPIREGVFQRVAGYVRAVDGVSFDVPRGKTVGLVGESGCGKSTLGRCIAGLSDISGGGVYFRLKAEQRDRLDELLAVPAEEHTTAEREELSALERSHRVDLLGKHERMEFRRNCQVVFQDAFSALNPKHLIRDIVGRPLRIHRGLSGGALTERVVELLEEVGLSSEHLFRYPHQFSGGQRQRISIARALALEPDFVVLDEPTSALDVSVQAQILNLLHRLQQEYGLTYLFISHDLNVVRHMSDRIVVMYLGQVCEVGTSEQLFADPRHPYTEALLAANPTLEGSSRSRIRLQGAVPSPASPPSGCRFHTRCPQATRACGWDVADALDLLKSHGEVIEGLQDVNKTSPFVADLSFDTPGQARAAAEELRSPQLKSPLAAALLDVHSAGRTVHVAFDPVTDVQLGELADDRSSACILHTGRHRLRSTIPIP